MDRSSSLYQTYLQILQEELVPALGCTEPIAIAYASALARQALGAMPEKITVHSSGNIIKNVKGVIVPGTGNMRGIEVSAVLGAVGGDAAKKLEVLTGVTEEHLAETRRLVAQGICTTRLLPGKANLHLIVTAEKGGDRAEVEILDQHTHVVRIEKNGQLLFEDKPQAGATGAPQADRTLLNLRDIVDFADSLEVEDVRPLFSRQVQYNLAIANEGLQNPYGAQVGRTLMAAGGQQEVRLRARAYPAAGSDARMSGCTLPVVINSGSGNQGMTVSLPVWVYAQQLGAGEDRLLRALAVSNLTAIHQKTGIGRLSAYCGAVSAACGSGAGICYLLGDPFPVLEQMVINTLGNISGMVCDGAKPSCAAKIASAVDAALLGRELAVHQLGFGDGEGIVGPGAEETIARVGRMAREGMRRTDEEILHIMIGQ